MEYDALRRKISSKANNMDVYWNYPDLIETLESNTGIAATICPDDDTQLKETWGQAVEALIIKKGLPHIALRVADSLYALQLREQETAQRRFHKGVALQVIAETYLWTRRLSLAKRYFQLALIEDTLTYQDKDASLNSPAFRSLTRDLGAASRDLEQLIDFVLCYTPKVHHPEHPEQVYTDFILSDAKPKMRDVEREIFRVNPVYAKNLLEQAENGQTIDEKGDALEHLAAYLLSCVDGFEIIGKKHRTKDYEIDILVRNTIVRDPVLSGFGPYIPVECKNWTKSVGAEQVNHFLAKIQFHDCHCGIMLAKNGISGRGDSDSERQADRKNADLTVLKAFHRNGIIMMVLNAKDLEAVVRGESNVLSLLVREYERIRFDRSNR